MIHVGLDAPTTRNGAMTHGKDGDNTGIRLGQVACGRTSDRGSGHGGLVMGFGFEDEELRGERGKTEEEGEKKKKVTAFFYFLFLCSGTKLSFKDEIGRFLNLLDLVGIISNFRGGLWNLP